MPDYPPFGSLNPQAPPDRDAMGSVYGAPQSSVQWLRQYLPQSVGDFLARREQQALQPVSPREIAGDVINTGMNAMFAGPGALTANRPMLAKAQTMAAGGAPRESIWDQTGWFQGPDAKWRFEIPDNASSFKKPLQEFYDQETARYGHQAQETWLPNIFEHKALYEAYPEMDRARLFVGDSRSGRARGAYQGTDMEGSHLIGIQPKEGRTTMLHELQHAVQETEGFAKGGSSQSVPKNMIDYERARIMGNAKDNGWTNIGTMAGDAPDSIFAQSLYNRLAGEVEARAVQGRKNLTPEERRARYPWLDYDVPESEQFVLGPRPFGSLFPGP